VLTGQFFCPTRIYLGANENARLGEILDQLGAKRVLIVVDPALTTSDIYARVMAQLESRRIAVGSFSEIEPDPTDTSVAAAFQAQQSQQATALVALGGGSTIDVGKAVGILATNGGRIHAYEGIEMFSSPPLPMIAIPTTAGTGSEVSGSCVITDTTRNLKMSIRHAALNPARYAILDPMALTTMPRHVAIHSGMDAFVHAFESFISLNANPLTDALNLHAITLISANIRSLAENRSDLSAGLNMLCGSALAGMAFGITGLGNVHCMARFVGAYFHLSHGLSNAICLPYVAEFNLPAATQKYALVAGAMGVDLSGTSGDEAAVQAVRAIQKLCRDLQIPGKLRDAGADEGKFAEMAELCVKANYNRWNPRHTTYDDFAQLFRAAY
jgi:alcohol dehydrogenase